MDRIKKHKDIIFLVFLLMILMRTCGIFGNMNKLSEKNDDLLRKFDSIKVEMVTKQHFHEEMEVRMWHLLELEELGDNGRRINDLKNQYKQGSYVNEEVDKK